MTMRSPAWHRTLPAVAVGAVIVTAVLVVAKPVIVPLALALLLTFVLSPVVAGLQQRIGTKRVYAVGLTALLTFSAMGGVGYVVARQITGLAVELPLHKGRIRGKIEDLRGTGAGPFSELLKMVRDLTEGPAPTAPDGTPSAPATKAPEGDPPGSEKPSEAPVRPVVLTQPKESGLSTLIESVVPVVEPLAAAALVVILVLFMLINQEDLRDRLIGLVGQSRLSSTTRAMEDATGRVGRYLLSVLAVNIVFGVLFAAGLWLIGVQFAFLWGFLAAILRFIPFVGTWAAASFPILLSFAMSPGWAQPLTVFGFFVVLDLVTANVVEPIVFGHGTGVSPIALLVAAAFWAWVWGPIGLLLATPLTVCLVVLGQYVPRLGFLTLLLGNAPALPPPARLYQRLFARDKREAGERVAEYAALEGLEGAFDDMVIPALVIARRDRAQGGLTPDGEEFALTTTREIIAEVVAKHGLPVPPPLAVVVACPAHHAAEEPTLDMLAALLGPDGVRVDALTARSLPSDVVEHVERLKPEAVFVAVLPPGGLSQAAYLCRVLRKKFPALKIVVGWWGPERSYDKLLVKMRKAGASYVTTTLQQSRTQLRHVADVPNPPPVVAVPPAPVPAPVPAAVPAAVPAVVPVPAGRKSQLKAKAVRGKS